MDRYTVAGVLGELQEEFKIGDDYSGLLQTAFILSYTIFAPMFGYLGDRYSRRNIMIVSVLFWTAATLGGSFTKTYGRFFITRVFVGIGEASFCALAPTIIYDVTYKKIRKDALALFYIAIPIGSGLGFVVAAKAARIGGHWCWALRVTPIFGVIGSLFLCLIKDPVRGERERLEMGKTLFVPRKSFTNAIRGLSRNPSYLLSTFGFTSVTFVTGAMAWWGPIYLHSGFRLISGEESIKLEDVALNFGAVAVCTGLIGVPLGAFISRKLIRKYPAIDPIICGVGLILSDPLIVQALFAANKSIMVSYICVFMGEVFMNVTWTVVADILLSVVVPEARSTAEAFQIAISHAFGDAGSPYLVGLLSEKLKAKWTENQSSSSPVNMDVKHVQQFEAMRYALLSIVFVQLIGGMLFIVNAFYIVADRELVIQTIANTSSAGPGQQTPPPVRAATERNLVI
ncbi:protein spinster-like [Eupeodes corollae]|uniref:protein spinster-like n=1 Tax=Eupeodes corollae TaxID=290404 RepID=UPI0024909615|nr:protein spinster-like [Eupeodes corollae]